MHSFPAILRAGVAVSLLVSAPAWAGPGPASPPKAAASAAAATVDQAAPQKARPLGKGEVIEAIIAASEELQRAYPWRSPMGKVPDELGSFRYTPATSAKLVRIFGTDQPLRFTKGAKAGEYAMTLQAVDYTSPDTSRLVWDAAQGKMKVDQDGRGYALAAKWPSVAFTDSDGTFTAHGITLTARQRRGVDDLPLGPMDVRIDRMRAAGKYPLAMANLQFGGEARAHGKLVDLSYRFSIGSIIADKLDLGSLAFGVTLDGIPAHVVARLSDASEQDNDPEALTAAQVKTIKSLARAVADAGGSVKLDELRYTLRGHSAWVKGDMKLKALPEGEVKADEVLKQLDGRFKMYVPLSLLAEISRTMTRVELEKRAAGKPVTEDQVKQAAQLMTDVMVGRMIGSGYATLEKDAIVSDVEIGGGKMLANGKPVEMPDFKGKRGDGDSADEAEERQPAADEEDGAEEDDAEEDAAG